MYYSYVKGKHAETIPELWTAINYRIDNGHIITLSAMKRNNALQSIGDINIYIPAQTYGWAESGHAAILHYWMDLLLSNS